MSGGKRKAADATGCQPQLLPGVLPAADNSGENGDSATPALCLGEPATKKRRVMFEDVTVYYFNRRQGFICVPSQGGNTLGMADEHFAAEVLSIDDHIAERRGVDPVINDDGQVELVDEEDADLNLLLPVDSKERRGVLREAGVQEINIEEKEECRQLRISRQLCGCTCTVSCDVDTCECAAGGIMCQVDRPGFPCACSLDTCGNPSGRLEFNPVKVRTHFVKTIMRTRLEEARYQAAAAHTSYLPGQLGYLAHLYNSTDTAGASCWGETAANTWDPTPSTQATVGWWTQPPVDGQLQVEEGEEEGEEGVTSSSDESDNIENDENDPHTLVNSIIDQVLLKVTGGTEPVSSLPDSSLSDSSAASSCCLSAKPFQSACALFPTASAVTGALFSSTPPGVLFPSAVTAAHEEQLVPSSCMAISSSQSFSSDASAFFPPQAVLDSTTTEVYSPLASYTAAAGSYLAATTDGGEQQGLDLPVDVSVTEDVHGENGYSYFQISLGPGPGPAAARQLHQPFYTSHAPYQFNPNPFTASSSGGLNSDLCKSGVGDVNYIESGLCESELELSCRSKQPIQVEDNLPTPAIENLPPQIPDTIDESGVENSRQVQQSSESSFLMESEQFSNTLIPSVSDSNTQNTGIYCEFYQKASTEIPTNDEETSISTRVSLQINSHYDPSNKVILENTGSHGVAESAEETVQTDSGLESNSSLDSSDNSQDSHYSDYTSEKENDNSEVLADGKVEQKDIHGNDINLESSSQLDESTADSQFVDSEELPMCQREADINCVEKSEKLSVCTTEELTKTACQSSELSNTCQSSNQAIDDLLTQNILESAKA